VRALEPPPRPPNQPGPLTSTTGPVEATALSIGRRSTRGARTSRLQDRRKPAAAAAAAAAAGDLYSSLARTVRCCLFTLALLQRIIPILSRTFGNRQRCYSRSIISSLFRRRIRPPINTAPIQPEARQSLIRIGAIPHRSRSASHSVGSVRYRTGSGPLVTQLDR
jgi:hypothetical protein